MVQDDRIIPPAVAVRAGARLNRVMTTTDFNPTTGKWEAVCVGFLTLPARAVAGGGDGVPKGKMTDGFKGSAESQMLAAQKAEDALRAAYGNCLPRAFTVPAPTAPLAG